MTGDINSSNVKFPPVACPGSSAINAHIGNFSFAICLDAWLNIAGGENMTGSFGAQNITPVLNNTYSLMIFDIYLMCNNISSYASKSYNQKDYR